MEWKCRDFHAVRVPVPVPVLAVATRKKLLLCHSIVAAAAVVVLCSIGTTPLVRHLNLGRRSCYDTTCVDNLQR